VSGPIFMHGDEEYIRNGTVTANTVAFISPRLIPEERDVPLVWSGQLTGDQLSFSVVPEDHDGPAREFTLTRRQTQ